MSETSVPNAGPGSEALARHVDQVCDRFEAAWKAAASPDQRPRIEDYLSDSPEPVRSALLRELILVDVEQHGRAGETVRLEEYQDRFPGISAQWLAAAGQGAPVQGPRPKRFWQTPADQHARRPGGSRSLSAPIPEREPVDALAEEFAARYRQGEHPSITEYTDKYPEHAEQIRALFPVLEVMEQGRPSD